MYCICIVLKIIKFNEYFPYCDHVPNFPVVKLGYSYAYYLYSKSIVRIFSIL